MSVDLDQRRLLVRAAMLQREELDYTKPTSGSFWCMRFAIAITLIKFVFRLINHLGFSASHLIRRRRASPKTSILSRHSRRTVPTRRSAYAFWHGDFD